MSVYRQKKIAMINDLSGYGRCSLTVLYHSLLPLSSPTP